MPSHPQPTTAPSSAPALTFGMLRSQPLRPGSLLFGALASLIALTAVIQALGHHGRTRQSSHTAPGSPSAASAGSAAGVPAPADPDDDSAFDTIVLADPADAPTPAPHSDREPSPVHPFAVVHLPHFGPEAGMIPDTPAGRALYSWLAAFNHSDPVALADVTRSPVPAAAAELDLRRQTGGLNLLSAREINPSLVVFRVRDQTTGTEALGTLQLRATTPPTIASLSLRSIRIP